MLTRSRNAARSLAVIAATTSMTMAASTALACAPVGPGSREAQQVYGDKITSIGTTSPAALLGTTKLVAAKAGTRPVVQRFKGTLTRNPNSNNANAFLTPEDDCERPSCIELRVKVPDTKQATLYARAAWKSTTQFVHIWGISPSGDVVGRSDVASSLDKRVGNADVTPLAEFTMPDPKPGVWRIQVRAVFGYKIPVHAAVALVKAPELQLPQLNVMKLADRYLTQNVTYNVVMVNRKWSKAEIAAFRATMPTDYRSGVLEKEFDDGCTNDGDDAPDQGVSFTAGTLANWGTSYYCGTGGDPNGDVPYFEPLHYRIHYRFLEADSTWTNDLFAVMKKHTKLDQPFAVLPPVGGRRQTQGEYIEQYDSQDGKAMRGPDHVVTDPTVGDKIDAFAVEDWIFNHRYDAKYRTSFKNLETGERHSGAFITPDPDAYYDPFYTATGKRDLDRMPQGPPTSYTFFAMDTFDGALADKYFRPNAYHYFDVSEHMIDPDLGDHSGPDMARAWGGRYRFFMHDLGAGPNAYESADTALTQNYGGSASSPLGDPPIWDYNNNPDWQGKLAERTARDARVWLFARFLGGYLYRPVPADVFALADTNWQDCYSNPECSAEGISYTDLKKIYDESYVKRNLGAALPGATFNSLTGTKGFVAYRHLGCAENRALAAPDTSLLDGSEDAQSPVLVPDPECVGKKPDPLQQLLEISKARGDELAGGVNDVAANPAVIRHYVEAHRAQLAPQPPGQFTLTNISVVWPGATTWALPAVVGGIAMGTPNGEGWGNLNNVNDRVKTTRSTVCDRSKPFAPGCNGVPPISGGAGFSYTIEHESSHFLGLTHPHDFFVVAKTSGGQQPWRYYGTGFAKYADFSMAPTTYAGAFAPYSVLDQDIIQKGHTAEYLRQMQNYLGDAYLQDGMKGRTTPSRMTEQKVSRSHFWMEMGSDLFRCGDYLHAERAMRNASLAAQGVFGPVVKPRQLQPGEKVLFDVNPQPVYGPDGKRVEGCAKPRSQSSGVVVTGGSPFGPLLPVGALLAVVAAVAVLPRRVRLPRPALV